jgi:class 3 adenylate cyclase
MRFGGEPIAIGVGLNAGRVFLGNIGGESKRQFTMLGPAVNAAAHLEALSKELQVPIVVGEDLYALLPEDERRRLRAHPGTLLKGAGRVTCYSAPPGD